MTILIAVSVEWKKRVVSKNKWLASIDNFFSRRNDIKQPNQRPPQSPKFNQEAVERANNYMSLVSEQLNQRALSQ